MNKEKDNIKKIWFGNSFIYGDEEEDCKYFHRHDLFGCINTCKGNEPYSCHRAKEEKLCHNMVK